MARFFAMGNLSCFTTCAKRNKVKHDCPLPVETLHCNEPSQDVCVDAATDSDVHKLSTAVKEVMDKKDSMTVRAAADVSATEECSTGSVIGQQSKSMVVLTKSGSGADSDFSFGPQIFKLCDETHVEIAYEGEDEQEVLPSSRELSDHESQRNIDNAVNSKESKGRNAGSSHTLDFFGNSSEVIFEINHECDKPVCNEEIQNGHLSDPGTYKTGDLQSGSTSPVLNRSSSGSKFKIKFESVGRSPDNHFTSLPPSNSQSFEDLQILAGSQKGLHGSQSSPRSELTFCSADKVMLKRRSSSNVLPSRGRNSWWKIFLWSHRNLHKGVQTEKCFLPHEFEEGCQAINRKGGYSSDTLDVCRNLSKTKEGEDLGKLKSLEDNGMATVLGDGQNASKVHNSRHMDWDHPSRVPGSWSQSQWVAFSAEQSNMKRVEEWVISIDTRALAHENGDTFEENGIGKGKGPVDGNCIAEISETFENLDTGIPDGNLSNEMRLANNVINSLNAFSTVAHISGIGLTVIPALARFTSLRTINLSGNYIVRITPGSLPRTLQKLDLSRNKITTIEGLRELTRLRVLDLSYNRISRIGHGLATCTLIKELYLAGNKISDVEGLHRLLKLAVLDLSFNKITLIKAFGQLAANYSSLLALNLLGNPVHTNVGDEHIKKSLLSLLPHLAYLNKQPIKTISAREAAVCSVARAALGNSMRHSRNKLSKRGNNASSSHRTASHSRRGSRASEGTSRTQGRPSKHIHDKGKNKEEHIHDKGKNKEEHVHSKMLSLTSSSSHHQRLENNVPLAPQSRMHISRSEGSLQDFNCEKSPFP